MGYRIFKDSRGTEWQTWDVVPRLGERRISERRAVATQPPHSDRRSPTDRRTLTGHRSVLTAGLGSGWLCFEAPAEKRRLTPIPSDWLHCTVDGLERYCSEAKVARRVSSAIDIVKVDN
ncbi:MAG: hypothetical protein ABIT20_23380 [Gemmatimonadaceae bacterium]